MHAQTKWHSGFSLEAGAGYNTFEIVSKIYYFNTTTTFRRTAFAVQPTIRLSYRFSLSKKDSTKFLLAPFVGYYIFGGKSSTEVNGYKDVYKFSSIEAGIIPSMQVYKQFYAGGGIKGQYVFSAKQKYYGVLNQPDSEPRTWKTKDVSELYYSFACNAGWQLKYRIDKFTIAAEGWYGLSDLFALQIDLVDVRAMENNYRILIGYNF